MLESVQGYIEACCSVQILPAIPFSLVVLLLKRGAKLGPVDEDGKVPST